jgi:hypothetical protein
LELRQKPGILNTSCQYWWFKTADLRVYSMDPSENATTPYDSLSIAAVGAYQTIWWSPTKYHMKPVMIQMNSHGPGMYLLVLIKIFHFALKCYTFQKPSAVFGAPVYVTTINMYCRPCRARISILRMYKLVNVYISSPWNFGSLLPNTQNVVYCRLSHVRNV